MRAPSRPVAECLQTERLLLLRCPPEVARAAVEDPARVPALLGLRVDPEWPTEDLFEVLPSYADAWESDPLVRTWSLFLVVDRARRCVVGDIGFKSPPDSLGAVEIGYGIVPSRQGIGYATEAVKALVEWTRRQPAARVMRACCYLSNRASRRVLEKSGFRSDGSDGVVIDWSLQLRRSRP